MKRLRKYLEPIKVAPVRERGLKCEPIDSFTIGVSVAPVRERGLKFVEICDFDDHTGSRSREGAWIEI